MGYMCLHIEKDKYIVKDQVYVILCGKEMEEICRNVVWNFENTLGIWGIYISTK